MYLLTAVRGRQMIFFSLAHVALGFALVVAVSGIAFVALAAFAFVVVLLNLLGKSGSGGSYARKMAAVLAVQVVHTILLFTYDHWAAALFP